MSSSSDISSWDQQESHKSISRFKKRRQRDGRRQELGGECGVCLLLNIG